VNLSGYDFTIQDRPDGVSVIRFGLGAIKNVGQGPVDAILQARQEGPIEAINDFAHRVDLRQVGKRALECLIRVGALDPFGSRQALLHALDRIVSVSASHFRALDVGQMSLFGPQSGVIEALTLPKVSRREPEVNRREQLNWERELIGLYVSDHPLNPVMDDLTQAITHFSGQLPEAGPNERVRVAGIISRIRPHQTKRGKSMGFVTLEDLQGNIELVVFPRSWEQYADLIEFDKIIMVEGRVDNQGAESKVLVDTISTDLSITSPPDTYPNSGRQPAPDRIPQVSVHSDSRQAPPVATSPNRALKTQSKAVGVVGAADELEEPEPVELDDLEDDTSVNTPPPPSAFPPDWDLANAVVEAVSQPEVSKSLADAAVSSEPTQQVPAIDAESSPQQPEDEAALAPPLSDPVPAPVESAAGFQEDLSIKEAPTSLPPYILSPIRPSDGDHVSMITVVLRPTGDKVRDNLRIRQIYGTLITYPGRDRFAFQVFERGRGYLIEFPNFTTGLCPELITRLRTFIPHDHLRIESITFQ
jgi:DNA polymerase-3 subunit alpha